MEAYQLPKLVLMWEHERLTPDQMLGQMLLHIMRQQTRMEQLEAKLLQHTRSDAQGNGVLVTRNRRRARKDM